MPAKTKDFRKKNRYKTTSTFIVQIQILLISIMEKWKPKDSRQKHRNTNHQNKNTSESNPLFNPPATQTAPITVPFTWVCALSIKLCTWQSLLILRLPHWSSCSNVGFFFALYPNGFSFSARLHYCCGLRREVPWLPTDTIFSVGNNSSPQLTVSTGPGQNIVNYRIHLYQLIFKSIFY